MRKMIGMNEKSNFSINWMRKKKCTERQIDVAAVLGSAGNLAARRSELLSLKAGIKSNPMKRLESWCGQ